MATIDPTHTQHGVHNNTTTDSSKELNGSSGYDHAAPGAHKQRAPYDYGGNPLAHIATNNPDMRLAAFDGEFQPGLHRAPKSNFANPAPLGLSAFALTTFVLSLINLNTKGITAPNIVVALAFGYGGLVQLLAGMWEMAVGNTFGATALSSYGGFWIAFAIVLTPGGFQIVASLEGTGAKPNVAQVNYSLGLFLMGWWIFTTILLICTLRSTLAFFSLFFTLDLAFLFLAVGHLNNDGHAPTPSLIKTGGVFGLLAAFLAWYNALAGIADSSNSFFVVPVLHFPWSDKARERRAKVDNAEARAHQV